MPQFPCLWKGVTVVRGPPTSARLGWGSASRALSGVSYSTGINVNAAAQEWHHWARALRLLSVGEREVWRAQERCCLALASPHSFGSSERSCDLGRQDTCPILQLKRLRTQEGEVTATATICIHPWDKSCFTVGRVPAVFYLMSSKENFLTKGGICTLTCGE